MGSDHRFKTIPLYVLDSIYIYIYIYLTQGYKDLNFLQLSGCVLYIGQAGITRIQDSTKPADMK